MASLKDVAMRAGVSTATVSNTINRPEMVRPGTRRRVELAIRDLEWVPNEQARILAGGGSQVLGLVVLDTLSPFFMEAARAVEESANEEGNVVIVCNSNSSLEREEQLLKILAAQKVRGILLTPSSEESLDLGRLKSFDVPLVFLDARSGPDACSVSVDDEAGGAMAVDHLLDLGHRSIAFVGGVRTTRQFRQRADGGKAAMRARGLDPAQHFREVFMTGMGIPDGSAAVDRLFDEGPTPTAIYCGNDMLAFGVYRGLARLGVRVPEDVALVGYDDIDVAADWIVPLTSIRQPTAELGHQAAQLLLDHSREPGHRHRQIVLNPRLVVRNSTSPVN